MMFVTSSTSEVLANVPHFHLCDAPQSTRTLLSFGAYALSLFPSLSHRPLVLVPDVFLLSHAPAPRTYTDVRPHHQH